MRSLCDEYGLAKRESDRLFDTLDTAKEGTINLKEFTELVSQNAQAAADGAWTTRGPSDPSALETTLKPLPTAVTQDDQDKKTDKGKGKDKKEDEVVTSSAHGVDPGKLLASLRSGDRSATQIKLLPHEVEKVFDEVAVTTARNKKDVRRAYQHINCLGNPGKPMNGINREKIREYMGHHGYTEGVADQVFDMMDADGSNCIDFSEFREMFGPYIMPDWNKEAPKQARGFEEPPPEMTDRALGKVVEDLGWALRKKYSSAHDCFRTLDTDGSGTLDRDEVREFFGRFAYDEETADKFFDHLDSNGGKGGPAGDGLVSRRLFAAHFTPYIVQGYDPYERKGEPDAYLERLDKPKEIEEPDLALAVKTVGRSCRAKYRSILKAWRRVDEDKDGRLDRKDVRRFFTEFGYDNKMGDRFFDHVNADGSDDIDYREFQTHFAPYIYGWSELGVEDQRVGILQDHIEKNKDLGAPVSHEIESKSAKAQRLAKERQRVRDGKAKATDLLAKEIKKTKSGPPSTAGSDRPPGLKKAEVEAIFNDIALKTARNKASVRRAFHAIKMWGRPEDTQIIDRRKFKDYMHLFGYDENVANQVFNYIDADGGGTMDYGEFRDLFGDYILPSWTVDNSTIRRDLPPPAKDVTDKPLRKVIHQLGMAVARKYKSSFNCFRTLDCDGNGTLSKDEVREFFGRFAYPKETADKFYDILHKNDEGDVDYREFASHFTPYIIAGYDGKVENRDPEDGCMETILPNDLKPEKLQDKKLNEVVRSVSENAAKRFGTIRRAWRTVDLDKDGKICRGEMRTFFHNMGHEEHYADKFFDHVNADGSEDIDYREFQRIFAPYIYGFSDLGQEDDRIGILKIHNEAHKDERAPVSFEIESRSAKAQRLEKEAKVAKAEARRKAALQPEETPAQSKQDDARKTPSEPRSSCGSNAGSNRPPESDQSDPRKTRTGQQSKKEADRAKRRSASAPSTTRDRDSRDEFLYEGPSDKDLNMVVSKVCEKMREKHGENTHKVFKKVSGHKDYVTRDDVQKLFSNYGYGGAADKVYQRLDGDGTGGVNFSSFQKLFSNHRGNPEYTIKGQTSYGAAFGS